MKKQYITPLAKYHCIKAPRILSGSNTNSIRFKDTPTDHLDAKKNVITYIFDEEDSNESECQ